MTTEKRLPTGTQFPILKEALRVRIFFRLVEALTWLFFYPLRKKDRPKEPK
jgi:hypothetical protein